MLEEPMVVPQRNQFNQRPGGQIIQLMQTLSPHASLPSNAEGHANTCIGVEALPPRTNGQSFVQRLGLGLSD